MSIDPLIISSMSDELTKLALTPFNLRQRAKQAIKKVVGKGKEKVKERITSKIEGAARKLDQKARDVGVHAGESAGETLVERVKPQLFEAAEKLKPEVAAAVEEAKPHLRAAAEEAGERAAAGFKRGLMPSKKTLIKGGIAATPVVAYGAYRVGKKPRQRGNDGKDTR